MKLRPALTPPALVAACAMAMLLTWLIAWRPFSAVEVMESAFLRLVCASAGPGTLNVSFDEGHGYYVDRSPEFSTPLERTNAFVTIEAPLPPGRIRELRIEVEGVPEFRVQAATIHTARRVLRELPWRELKGAEVHETYAALRPRQAMATLRLTPPLVIETGAEPGWGIVVGTFSVSFAAMILLQAWVRLPKVSITRPKLTIALVALAAVLLNAYPIVFLGKSLVSPNTLAYLLYCGEPTIPGAPREPLEYGAGSDLGATMWQNLPYSVVESTALWRDHELPLWNRYNSGGISLLGQGLSMFGDPLHCIPLLAGGAWWAWDIKFLLAKFLFALGIGWCAWSLTRRLVPSALVAASVVWIGFFVFRYNHPGYFSLCYAPWILLPWLMARKEGRIWPATGLLVLADWAVLSSGTVKESAILLLGLNATGLFLLWPRKRVWPMLWASFLFLLLSAPMWLVFLDTLRHAVTIYDAGRAFQLQPGMLAAFFDPIFSQDFTRHERVTQPSLNFLLLVGVAWAIFRYRKLPWPLVAGSLAASAFVFGIVPPAWIITVPFIGKIEHIYNAFGCVLIVLLPLVAAFGFAAPLRSWKPLLLIGGCVLLYFGFRQAQPLSAFASYRSEGFLYSRFFDSYLLCLLLATAGVFWSWRWLHRRETRVAGVLLFAACCFVLHFRQGMYVETKFDGYVMNPRTGFELNAASPALAAIRRELTEPARVYGFSATLAPGYNALLGLEGIGGPDALHNPYYQELCAAAGVRQVWEWRWVVDPETIAAFRPIYDMLNLRFYLHEIEGPSPQLPGLTFRGRSDLEIYESKSVWPRAFFTDACSTYQTPAGFARLVKQGDGRPFAAWQGAAVGDYGARLVVKARDYRLTNNSTEFSVTAPKAGVIVLGETFEDGNFRVMVNGEPREVVRVNHAFKGVVVPQAGEYRVRFTYQPRMLLPALGLSGLGLLAVAATILCRWRTESLAPAGGVALPLLS